MGLLVGVAWGGAYHSGPGESERAEVPTTGFNDLEGRCGPGEAGGSGVLMVLWFGGSVVVGLCPPVVRGGLEDRFVVRLVTWVPGKPEGPRGPTGGSGSRFVGVGLEVEWGWDLPLGSREPERSEVPTVPGSFWISVSAASIVLTSLAISQSPPLLLFLPRSRISSNFS